MDNGNGDVKDLGATPTVLKMFKKYDYDYS